MKILEVDKQGLILCGRKSIIKTAIPLEEFLVLN